MSQRLLKLVQEQTNKHENIGLYFIQDLSNLCSAKSVVNCVLQNQFV